jgi:hypothetical protein
MSNREGWVMVQREIPDHLNHRVTLLLRGTDNKVEEFLDKKGYFERDDLGKRQFSAWVDEELDQIEREEILGQG